MLYQFRYPRTRPWDGYIKSVHKVLKAVDETLIVEFDACQEQRTKLVKLLDDCAKDARMAPKDIILILNEYIPTLEKFIASIEEHKIIFTKKIEIVWTSVLTFFLNCKSLSYSFQWERIMIFILLGICEYQRAIELHRTNRVQAADKAKEAKEEKKGDDQYEAIFGDVKPIDDPQIFDDKEVTKQISFHLKTASGVWAMMQDYYPGNIEEPKKEYTMIPESIPDIPEILSRMAKANVEEFFVQQAVQSKISNGLVSKLAMGVATDLHNCSQKLIHSMPQNIAVKHDFRHYLRDRAGLYSAISHKYCGKACKEKEDYVTAAAHYRDGKISAGFKPDGTNTKLAVIKQVKKEIKKDVFGINCLAGIEHSLIKQIKDLTELENEVKEDIFGYPVPKASEMDKIEPKYPKGAPTFKSFDEYLEFSSDN